MGRRMSAKRMEAAVRAYFAQCDGTRERVPQKGGGFAERQIPYTLYGLSAAVSLSPQEVLLAAHGRGQGEGPILMRGLVRVAGYLQERAGHEADLEAVNSRIAQNENNLNQDLSILYNKLLELEAALAARGE